MPSYFRPKNPILYQNAELQNKPDFSSWKVERGGGKGRGGEGEEKRGRRGTRRSEFTYKNGLPALPKLYFHGLLKRITGMNMPKIATI